MPSRRKTQSSLYLRRSKSSSSAYSNSIRIEQGIHVDAAIAHLHALKAAEIAFDQATGLSRSGGVSKGKKPDENGLERKESVRYAGPGASPLLKRSITRRRAKCWTDVRFGDISKTPESTVARYSPLPQREYSTARTGRRPVVSRSASTSLKVKKTRSLLSLLGSSSRLIRPGVSDSTGLEHNGQLSPRHTAHTGSPSRLSFKARSSPTESRSDKSLSFTVSNQHHRRQDLFEFGQGNQQEDGDAPCGRKLSKTRLLRRTVRTSSASKYGPTICSIPVQRHTTSSLSRMVQSLGKLKATFKGRLKRGSEQDGAIPLQQIDAQTSHYHAQVRSDRDPFSYTPNSEDLMVSQMQPTTQQTPPLVINAFKTTFPNATNSFDTVSPSSKPTGADNDSGPNGRHQRPSPSRSSSIDSTHRRGRPEVLNDASNGPSPSRISPYGARAQNWYGNRRVYGDVHGSPRSRSSPPTARIRDLNHSRTESDDIHDTAASHILPSGHYTQNAYYSGIDSGDICDSPESPTPRFRVRTHNTPANRSESGQIDSSQTRHTSSADNLRRSSRQSRSYSGVSTWNTESQRTSSHGTSLPSNEEKRLSAIPEGETYESRNYRLTGIRRPPQTPIQQPLHVFQTAIPTKDGTYTGYNPYWLVSLLNKQTGERTQSPFEQTVRHQKSNANDQQDTAPLDFEAKSRYHLDQFGPGNPDQILQHQGSPIRRTSSTQQLPRTTHSHATNNAFAMARSYRHFGYDERTSLPRGSFLSERLPQYTRGFKDQEASFENPTHDVGFFQHDDNTRKLPTNESTSTFHQFRRPYYENAYCSRSEVSLQQFQESTTTGYIDPHIAAPRARHAPAYELREASNREAANINDWGRNKNGPAPPKAVLADDSGSEYSRDVDGNPLSSRTGRSPRSYSPEVETALPAPPNTPQARPASSQDCNVEIAQEGAHTGSDKDSGKDSQAPLPYRMAKHVREGTRVVSEEDNLWRPQLSIEYQGDQTVHQCKERTSTRSSGRRLTELFDLFHKRTSHRSTTGTSRSMLEHNLPSEASEAKRMNISKPTLVSSTNQQLAGLENLKPPTGAPAIRPTIGQRGNVASRNGIETHLLASTPESRSSSFRDQPDSEQRQERNELGGSSPVQRRRNKYGTGSRPQGGVFGDWTASA